MLEIFDFIGIISFAISGAIVALEEHYDLLGFYVLGFITSFGGGAIRNLLTGIPIESIWSQNALFITAFITITAVFLTPRRWLEVWEQRGIFFDALGLAVFCIQGAFAAKDAGMPLSGIIVAATLTGSGGGVVRDVLAQREPMIMRSNIYALWAALAGLLIGLGIIKGTLLRGILIVAIVVGRLAAVHYNWRLPRRR